MSVTPPETLWKVTLGLTRSPCPSLIATREGSEVGEVMVGGGEKWPHPSPSRSSRERGFRSIGYSTRS